LRARAFLFLFLAAAVAASPAAGGEDAVPETRAEQWTRLRREKAARPAAPHPGFLQRQLLALEKAERPSLFAFNLEGVYPRVLNIASGSELAGGVRLWRPDMGASLIDLHASAFYSIRGYEYYDLQVGRMAHRGAGFPARSTSGDDVYEMGDVPRVDTGRAVLYGSARYRHYPQTAFYGLGSDSQPDGRTNFLNQDALYEVVTGYQGPRGVATVSAGLMQAFVGPGTDDEVPSIRVLYDDQSAPGLDRQPDFVHLAARLLLDRRDEPGNPHRGGMIALAAARFDERGGDEFVFNRISGDARAYASLGSRQRVLAVRALASADRPASGARVPFYLQEGLGGGHTLRGFRTFRFRGEKVILFQAEYRWEAWPALEFALFADAGRAYGHGEAFALRDLETDYGFGVRLKTHQGVVARFDIGRSDEITRYLFRFSPSF
jgi:surface antigen Omp85-like protein